MDSAFGVDHGEFEKAAPRVPKGAKRAVQIIREARHNRSLNVANKASGIVSNEKFVNGSLAVGDKARAGAAKGFSEAKKVPGKLAAMTPADIGRGVGNTISAGATKLGEFTGKHPGAVGGTVIAGTGVGLYRSGRTKKKRDELSKSAFGVEHTEISKGLPSALRSATRSIGGYHGFQAGDNLHMAARINANQAGKIQSEVLGRAKATGQKPGFTTAMDNGKSNKALAKNPRSGQIKLKSGALSPSQANWLKR